MIDGRVMIQARVREQIGDAPAGAGFRIPRAEYQPSDAGMLDRARAHCARFQGDI